MVLVIGILQLVVMASASPMVRSLRSLTDLDFGRSRSKVTNPFIWWRGYPLASISAVLFGDTLMALPPYCVGVLRTVSRRHSEYEQPDWSIR